MRKTWFLLGRLLPIIAAARKGKMDKDLPHTLVQLLLARGFARTPMGLVGMFLLRKALAGKGRVFGMDLASRRKARLAWLAGLLQRFTGSNTKSPVPFRRRLSR
jgi:hypothetical protein